MTPRAYITLVLMLLLSSISTVMAQGHNSLIIADDRLVLQIDLKSTLKQLDSILNVAGISKANTEKISHGDFNVLKDDGWNFGEKKDNIIRFERSMTDLSNNPQSRPYRITAQIPNLNDNPGYPARVNYGVNKFAKITVYELASGLTRFILPGYERSKRVFLSGNFNDWSTLKGLMKKTDGGWLLDVKLEAGVCEYKFITDGRWTTDPDNFIRTNDGAGNVNSVYYKYNYTFKLPGYPSAHKVIVTGEFNSWNSDELVLEKKGTTWQLQMYLGEGKHLYYFVVNDQRTTDPLNQHREKNEAGNLSSVLNIGEAVTFKLGGYPNAKKITVSGSFNNWDENVLQMQRVSNGWVLPETFPAGNYSYKFIVDGTSITDPQNPLTVFERGELKSFLALKPTRYFILKGYGNAKNVTLHGTFNDWEPHGYTMARKGDDWIIGFNLKPGKYLYKFIVDGRWILDPGNKFWEQNQYNTGNSVLWVE
jgi:Glycogen recognition site of AMP-activated protein kinase